MAPKLLTFSLLFFLLGRVSAQGPLSGSGTVHSSAPAGTTAPTADDSILIRRLADTILTDGKTYGNLRTLTKTIGARLSGSAGYYKAESWGMAALQDAQAGKVWMQECMVPHWIRGGKDSAVYTIGGLRGIKLDILALGNSVGTGPQGLMKEVILIHDFDELERRKNEVKGKIVFYNYKFNPLFIETFLQYSDAVRYRVFGASEAAKYGAVAMLTRSMSASVDNNPHTGALVYNDSFPKIPAAAVGLRDADRLASLLENEHKGSEPVQVYLRTNARMLPDTAAHNIIGELKGTEFPDQYITVGGHLDSWDPAEGAMDDGAGCVQSIEVLRALKAIGYQPKHSIRVVLFANEENGGRGGEKYSSAAKSNKETHLLGLESDAGGFTPRAFSLSVNDAQLANIQPWLPLFHPYGVFEFDKGGGGSDVSPMGPTLGAVVGEFRPDSQRYFDLHHSRADVLENVNKRELELGVVNMAALIYLVDKYGFGK